MKHLTKASITAIVLLVPLAFFSYALIGALIKAKSGGIGVGFRDRFPERLVEEVGEIEQADKIADIAERVAVSSAMDSFENLGPVILVVAGIFAGATAWCTAGILRASQRDDDESSGQDQHLA